jgi:hypothetical protein
MANRYLVLLLLAAWPSAANAQTLTGHWLEPGWTPAASTTVTAAVGNNATLTNAGNVDSIDDPGSVPGTAFAQSLHLGQTDANDGLEVSHVISGSTAHSVCMWVNPDEAAPTGSNTFLFSNASDTAGLTHGHSNASYRNAGYRAPNSYPVASWGSLTAGTWYHIAYVWDGSNLRVFKDGAQVGSDVATASTGADTVTCYIGNASGYAEGFEGRIVDVRTYSGAIDAADISAIMAEADASAAIDPLSASIPGVSRDPLTGTIPGL